MNVCVLRWEKVRREKSEAKRASERPNQRVQRAARAKQNGARGVEGEDIGSGSKGREDEAQAREILKPAKNGGGSKKKKGKMDGR